MDDDDIDPWERQPGESTKRYTQFLMYRDMGPARTLARVAQELALNPRYVRAISAEWLWVARAGAHDQVTYQERAARIRAERMEMDDRHARIARAVQGKIIASLQAVDPGKLSPNELARLLEVAVKVERMALGASSENVAVSGPEGGPVELADLSKEERDARLAALAAEAARRAGATQEALTSPT